MARHTLGAPITSNIISVEKSDTNLTIGKYYKIDFPTFGEKYTAVRVWQQVPNDVKDISFLNFAANVLPYLRFKVISKERTLAQGATNTKDRYVVEFLNSRWTRKVPAELTYFTRYYFPLRQYEDNKREPVLRRVEIHSDLCPIKLGISQIPTIITGPHDLTRPFNCINTEPFFWNNSGWLGKCIDPRSANFSLDGGNPAGCTDPFATNYNPNYIKPINLGMDPDFGFDRYSNASGRCTYDDVSSSKKAAALGKPDLFYNYFTGDFEEVPVSFLLGRNGLSYYLEDTSNKWELPATNQPNNFVWELTQTDGLYVGNSEANGISSLTISLNEMTSTGADVNVAVNLLNGVEQEVAEIKWDVEYLHSGIAGFTSAINGTGPGNPGNGYAAGGSPAYNYGGLNLVISGNDYNGFSEDVAYNNMQSFNKIYSDSPYVQNNLDFSFDLGNTPGENVSSVRQWFHVVYYLIFNDGTTLRDWGRFYLQQELGGCMDPTSFNYNPNATSDDGSCTDPVVGCMDNGSNFSTTAGYDSAGNVVNAIGYFATISGTAATNYNSSANIHDPSACQFYGCMDSQAENYNSAYTNSCTDPGSQGGCAPCTYDVAEEIPGCTDNSVLNGTYNRKKTPIVYELELNKVN